VECLPPELFALENLRVLNPRGNPLISPPSTLCDDIIYGDALMAADGSPERLWCATGQLRSYHRESRLLIGRRPELEGSQTAFCPVCFSVGFWRDGVFTTICEVPQNPRGEIGQWRSKLQEKAGCGKCLSDALLILGTEISCACKTHFDDGPCLVRPETPEWPRDYRLGRIFG
jgi:hypothetical protein